MLDLELRRMSITDQQHATLEDLYKIEGKAELVGGRIVRLMPTGRKPNRVAGRIYRRLDEHAEATGRGEAYTDNIGFTVPELSNGRQSFSPDASFYVGPLPENDMRFLPAAPVFAVEVRREYDYGSTAERALEEKRADYFAAGTQIVWDVDPVAECIHAYRASDPDSPVTFRRGQTADAEPAVADWSISVDWIFG